MREASPRRWAAGTAVAGTVFIAAGAFWLSFTSLADLAARSGIGVGQAWAWPLIVDGIIVVATVAVVALAGQRSAWYPWALLTGGALVSVTANAIHAVVAADADVPSVLAASVAAVPPVVLLAITHLTVILTRPGAGDAGPARGHRVRRDLRRANAERAGRRALIAWSRGAGICSCVCACWGRFARSGGSSCVGAGAAGGEVVEQADRPRTRRASLDRRPLVHPRTPHY